MPTWITQISHWVHTTFLSLHGLSVVSLILIVAAVVVALRLLSGILWVVVPGCAGGRWRVPAASRSSPRRIIRTPQ